MKIIYDYQTFALQSYGGISRYFVRLAKSLMAQGVHINVVAPLHRNRYLKELPKSSVLGVEFESFPPKTGRLALIANHHLSKFKLSSLPSDILHETYYSAKSVSAEVKGRVITVYDMIHEKYPSNFSIQDSTTKKKRLAVNRADHIICISESTKNDLCSMFNMPDDHITVVHLGFDKFESTSTLVKIPNEVARPFLLYVGSRGGYKNFNGLLRAVASSTSLKNTFDVVAFGGGSFNAAEQAMITQLGFCSDSVRQVGGGRRCAGPSICSCACVCLPICLRRFWTAATGGHGA